MDDFLPCSLLQLVILTSFPRLPRLYFDYVSGFVLNVKGFLLSYNSFDHNTIFYGEQ